MEYLTIKEGGSGVLPIYASIPNSLMVDSFFHINVIERGLGGFRLDQEKVDPPYLKDYDAAGCDGRESERASFDIRLMGEENGLPASKDRNSKHQRIRVPILCSPGMHFGWD